jgi:2-oxo-4-hydroxy-4-carboxy-5-ureidoimidazoline decarboxylase
VTIDQLNRLPDDEARAAFERCCGARAWVDHVCAGRPYRSRAGMFAAAERAADKLRRADWLEAFAHHPRIGDREALRTKFAATAAWAGEEQQGAAAATAATLDLLAEGNRAYEEQFGYIFIVCASDKSADQMLELLRGRLANDPDTELVNAGREQRAITRLRLEKLLEKTT